MGDQAKGSKKNLADMSKEELMEKCKSLVLLAQKARAAKDDAIKECLELKEKADRYSVLNEMVEKMTDEKLNFAAEKDDLKKKLKLSENNSEKLIEKLRLTEEKVDIFTKDVEQKNEIVKKLKRKMQELEAENESTKRQLGRITSENDSLLEQIDNLDTDLFKAQTELKESKTRIDQLQGLELTTQELKAKIICLEQSLSDKQRETENVRTELEQLKKEQKEKTKSLSQESTEAKYQLIQEISNLKEQNEQLLSKHEVETHETSNSFENLEEILQQKETELDSFKKLCQEKTNEIEQLTQTMTSQIETLQSRLLSQEESGKAAESEVEQLQNKLIEKDRETTMVRDELALLERAKDDAIKSKDKVCQDLTNEIKLLENQMISTGNDQASFKSQLEEGDRAKAELQQQLSSTLKLNHDLSTEKDQITARLNNEIKQLQDSLASAESDTDEQVSKLKIEKERIQSDLLTKTEEIVQLQEQITTTLKNQEELSCQLKNVKNELDFICSQHKESLSKSSEELESVNASLSEKSEEVENLKEQLETASKAFATLTKETNQAVEMFTSEIKQLKKQINSSGADVNESIKKLTNEKDHIENYLLLKEEEILLLNDQLTSSTRIQEDLSGQVKILKDQLDSSLAGNAEYVADLSRECNSLKSELSEKVKEIDVLKVQLSSSTENHQQTTAEIQELKAVLEHKDEEIVSISKQLSEASQNLKNLTFESSSRIEELKTAVHEKDNEIVELKEQLKAAAGTLEQLSSETNSRIEELNTAVASKEKEINFLQVQLLESTRSKDELDLTMETTIREKDSEIERLTQEVVNLKAQMTMLECNQGEAFDALLQETRSIKSELEGFTKLKEEHSLALQSLVAAQKQIQHLEDALSNNTEQTAALTDEQKQLIQQQLSAVKSLSMEVDNFRGETVEQFASCSEVLKECESTFGQWKASFDRELLSSQQQNLDLIEDLNKMNVEIRTRGERLSSLVEKNDELIIKLDSLGTKLEEKEKVVTKLQEEVEVLRAANQSLKQDTETIIQDFKKQVSNKEVEIETLQRNLNDSKINFEVETSNIQEREREIDRLQRQVQEQNESLNNRSLPLNRSNHLDESQSEVMSTSTISKVEEVNRMADIEATFEDRYAKLKLVAIKLKKKTVDQEKKIAELELAQKDTGKLAQVMANFANLQSEYDAVQDTSESQGKQLKVLSKDLEHSVQECIKTKEKLAETESDLAEKNSRLSTVTSELAERHARIMILEEERNCQDKTIEKLSLENKELSEKVGQVVSKLDQLSHMNKKQDLLDMELEEAETRISQLSRMFEETKADLESKEVELKLEIEARLNREMQIKELEDTLNKETERAQDLKAKLTSSRETIAALEESLDQTGSRLEQLQRELDRSRGEGERLSLQLAEISGNAMTSAKSLTARNESLQKMVTLLETEVERKRNRSDELEARLTTLEKDYENYKVRAQSVLRQAKDKDSHLNEKSQEVANLERVVSSLTDKIQDISTQHSALDLERRHLQEDHDRLMERHSALLQEMAAKEKGAREKLEQLSKIISEAELSKQTAITHWQQEAENIRQNYRFETESMASHHAAEVARLQQNIDKLDNQVIRLQMVTRKSPSTQQHQNQRNPSVSPRLTDIELSLLEREAAEGSESADTSYQRGVSMSPVSQMKFGPGRSHDDSRMSEEPQPLLPLDQLLLQKEEEQSESNTLSRQTSEMSGFNNSSWTEAAAQLEKKAISAEKQVKHMASLLSESEAENARLIELAQVLKEEIRSYRRSEERSKHIDNLEYVKNVILKFLTLPESVERARLIPVLSTILKLSKEEIETVQSVVAADAEQVSSQDTGWSSYLGLWNP